MSNEAEQSAQRKPKIARSPSYPNFSLPKALEKTRDLYKQEGMYEAPLPAVAKAWGYSEKSSGARQALATLRYFGLIDVTGEGDARRVRVSDVARRILLDEREDQTEKRSYIKKAALTPSAHRALFNRFPEGLTSDASVTHFLVFEEGFNQSAAEELLAEFKETVAFSNIYEPSKPVDKPGQLEENLRDKPEVKIGDRVQWTSQGSDQFSKGAIVLGFSDDRQWIFTDQGMSGIPAREVSVMETAVVANTPPPIPAHLAQALGAAKAAEREEAKAGTRKAVFPVEEGDVTLIFPENLSAEGLSELGEYLDIFLKKEQKKKQGGA